MSKAVKNVAELVRRMALPIKNVTLEIRIMCSDGKVITMVLGLAF